jgi:hypothetical protein
MRLWSLHPKYLDSIGLIALWRETLLAKKVLEGNTKGYTQHPQLHRFKQSTDPVNSICYYLNVIYEEAAERNYSFNINKIDKNYKPPVLSVTTAQIEYEIRHLLKKLKLRNGTKYREVKSILSFDAHPLFEIIPGKVEDWEMVSIKKKAVKR